MIRKLAFALTLLSVSFSSALYALGLGEANVSSSLNQPLQAEIEILNVKGLSEEEILPGLATREEFIRAGVDRVYFLSDLRFKVEQNASGAFVVKLTTNKPVREPFLNFLVEVIWPSGRLLREYALLIDPPLFSEEPPKPVVAAPVSRVESGDQVRLPEPAPAAPSSRSLLDDAPTTTGTYGPTNSRDTLWDIALKARPDRSVSPQQVMLAIQDLNPGAFIDGNINKLKAGQVLRLPSKEQIQARSLSQAINQVIAQNEALNPRKKVISAAKSKPKSTPKAAPSVAQDELKLVVANNANTNNASADSSNDTSSGSGKGSSEELALALERLDKSSLENEELAGKVEDLESQLETLQRLLTLKNDQLASLQTQARENELKKAQAEQEAIDAEQAQPEIAQAQPGTDPSAETAAPVEAPVAEVAAPEGDQVSEAQVSEVNAEAEASQPAVAPAVAQDKPAAKPPASSTTESIFDLILGNPIYQAAVGIGLLLLLVILWLVSKNNARKEAEAYDSSGSTQDDVFGDKAVAEIEEDAFPEDGDDVSEAYDLGDDQDEYETYEEDSYEQSDASDDLETEGEKEDLIGEADVYIAYGRLDQAASILEQGIENDPIRTDYRLKLLEVYAETGESEAFGVQFSELEAIQDQDAIARALEIKAGMTQNAADSDELPDELLSEAAQEESLEEEVSESLDNSFDFESVESELEEDDMGVDLESEELDLDLDIDLKTDSAEDSVEDALAEEVDEIDAGIDFEKVEIEPQKEPESSEPEALESSDDDQVELSPELLDEGALEDSEPVTEDDADDDLELELELSEDLEAEAEIDLAEDLSIPDELLDIDGSEAASSEEISEELSAEVGAEAAELEVDEDDSTIIAPAASSVVSDDILEEATDSLEEDTSGDSELEPDEDFDFLDGTDESSTKLDLARAYIDMGDIEGARDILLEVEKEGSDEQQADARALIDSLGV